jgi:integrase
MNYLTTRPVLTTRTHAVAERAEFQIYETQGTTFFDLVEMWKTHTKPFVKKSTFGTYLNLLERHVTPIFGQYTFMIPEDDVQDFVIKKIEGGLSVKSVKDIIVLLSTILKFGRRKNLFRHEPFQLRYPKAEKRKIMVLTKYEQKKIMDHIKKAPTPKGIGVLLALGTGMRIGEICGLTWGDIDTVRAVVYVNRTYQRIYEMDTPERKTEVLMGSPKTPSSCRDIPLNKFLLDIIKPYIKKSPKNFFVLTDNERPTEPRNYRDYYNKLIKTLNIEDMNFHALRHTFATRCIESGCDVKTVSVLLGHSNIATTLNLYVHPGAEQKAKAVDKMFKSL